jgi:outer membrane protein assembly factor BamB
MVATVTAAGLAVLAVLSIIVAVTRAKGPDHPVTPAPSGTSLRRVGAPLPVRGQAFTMIAGNRAFIASSDNETLQVTALDTASGRLLWTHALPGPHALDPRLSTEPGVFIVYDLTGESPDSRRQITVLDVATGATLWSHVSPEPAATGTEYAMEAPAAAILVSPEANEFRGLDWRTGRTMWTRAGGAPMLDTTPAPGPVDVHSGIPPTATVAATFYVRQSDATMREYAIATGRPTGRKWTGVPEPTNLSFISRGKLYTVTSTELSTFDLGGDGPSVAYTAHPVAPGTRDPQRLSNPVPCGGDAICVIDGGGPDAERGVNPYRLVMLRTGAEPMTRDLPATDGVVPVGETLYMIHGDILDKRLRPIKPAAVAETFTFGVDDGEALLVMDSDAGDSFAAGPMRFWMFDPAAGSVVELGSLTLPSVQLAMGDHRLVAITEDGVQLYSTQR